MPVTKLKISTKQPVEGDYLSSPSALKLPFKAPSNCLRLSLPTSEDDSIISDVCDEDDISSPELKLHRRRSSSSRRFSLYANLDAYSRFFSRPFDSSNRMNTSFLSSSYLRPNAKFVGEQQSGCARYEIKVEFKSVDLISSVVTGFFYISGLTDEHPLITTCFKGEIINNPLCRLERSNYSRTKKYSFITEEKNWSSFPKNDLDHWKKLTGSPSHYTEEDLRYKLQQIQAGNDDPLLIYMRWKEEFLLPDSRIKLLTGASFEGFYYIVLSVGASFSVTKNENDSRKLLPGRMNGLYFYTQSEKFQSLSLKYVEERGAPLAYTFA